MTARIVEFCRFVRANGFVVGVTGTLDALRIARSLPAGDQASLKLGLKAGLCSSKEEWDRFDALFQAFWNRKGQVVRSVKDVEIGVPNISNGSSAAVSDTEDQGLSGASAHARLRKTDFSNVPANDQAALEQLADRLLRRVSWRLSRTLTIAVTGARLDFRRTIRRNISRGGELMNLQFKARKRKQARLVVVVDVSGSMKLYSLFLLRFAHALQKHFKRAATFVFSTELVDVTAALRSHHVSAALQALSHEQTGWSGGTRIGESLRKFNRLPGRTRLSKDTLFIILSDGWDTGEPELLASELQTIKRQVKKLIWLNPLLGLDDYQPLTRGMAAALPHVDVFAPAHSLDSLLELERHLTRNV